MNTPASLTVFLTVGAGCSMTASVMFIQTLSFVQVFLLALSRSKWNILNTKNKLRNIGWFKFWRSNKAILHRALNNNAALRIFATTKTFKSTTHKKIFLLWHSQDKTKKIFTSLCCGDGSLAAAAYQSSQINSVTRRRQSLKERWQISLKRDVLAGGRAVTVTHATDRTDVFHHNKVPVTWISLS